MTWAAIGWAVIGWEPGVASAHAELIGVEPPAGAVVAETPDAVVISFTETVSLSGGSAALYDDAGTLVADGAEAIGDTVRLELPGDLADGTYLVAWRVISADSHPVVGTSPFSIGTPSTTAPVTIDVGDGPPVGVAAWRVLTTAAAYAGALVAVGGAAFSRRWNRLATSSGDTEGLEERHRRLDRLVTLAGATGIVALLAGLPARLVTVGGDWDALTDGAFVGDALTGAIGQAAALSVIGLVGLLLWRPGRAGTVFALLALGGFVIEGHTRTKEPVWLMTVSDIVHLVAGALWLGGVAALAVMLRPNTGHWRARVVADVSSAAVWSVAAVATAGVVMSVIVLPDFNALVDTGYGIALMVKIALVIVLLALGQRNRMVLVPAIVENGAGVSSQPADTAVPGLRRSTAAGLVVFGLVLLATATLVGRSPVVESEAIGTGADQPASDPIPLSSGAGAVTIRIDPGTIGSNVFVLTLVDRRGAPLALVEPPTIELRERSRGIGPLVFVAAELSADGSYPVPVDIPFAGTWDVQVDARTGTFDTGSAGTEITIEG